TLADVSDGAKLAVYGDKPAFFPPLGSREDDAARVSKALLKVVRAGRSSAVAECEAAPFALPPGARARLVEPGAARLRCAAVPEDAKLAAALRASPLLEVVSEREAQARLERQPDGSWRLTDEVYGAKPDFPALATLRPDQVDLARQVLELYCRYSLPLRMATRCADLPGQLRLGLLAWKKGEVAGADAQTADLPEVPRDQALGYSLKVGAGFCVQVRNASARDLRVAVVNCAASGAVEFLGDQALAGGSTYRFWLNNDQGEPFVAMEVEGARRYLDRMVAIGTTCL